MTSLPSNLEIEQSILASCLLHQDDAELAASVLTPEDFYSSAHSLIFDADLAMETSRMVRSQIQVQSALAAIMLTGQRHGLVSELFSSP